MNLRRIVCLTAGLLAMGDRDESVSLSSRDAVSGCAAPLRRSAQCPVLHTRTQARTKHCSTLEGFARGKSFSGRFARTARARQFVCARKRDFGSAGAGGSGIWRRSHLVFGKWFHQRRNCGNFGDLQSGRLDHLAAHGASVCYFWADFVGCGACVYQSRLRCGTGYCP